MPILCLDLKILVPEAPVKYAPYALMSYLYTCPPLADLWACATHIQNFAAGKIISQPGKQRPLFPYCFTVKCTAPGDPGVATRPRLMIPVPVSRTSSWLINRTSSPG